MRWRKCAAGCWVRWGMRFLVGVNALSVFGCGPGNDLTFYSELHEALRVCADGPTVDGIDVSQYQGNIRWDQVANAGIKYAYVRVSHDIGTLDTKFDVNWPKVKEVGIIRGVYQYFEASVDPVAQADLLLQKAWPEPGDLPPAVDVEEQYDGDVSKEQFAQALLSWQARITEKTGMKGVFYTRASYWDIKVGPGDFAPYPLWVAHYGATCPNLPVPWADWAFFQTGSTGVVPGITENTVDTDLFNGDLAALEKLRYQPIDENDDGGEESVGADENDLETTEEESSDGGLDGGGETTGDLSGGCACGHQAPWDIGWFWLILVTLWVVWKKKSEVMRLWPEE